MAIRPDMKPLAVELGCEPASRHVEIDEDTLAEFEKLAKRTHTTLKVVVNAALNAWLGRV